MHKETLETIKSLLRVTITAFIIFFIGVLIFKQMYPEYFPQIRPASKRPTIEQESETSWVDLLTEETKQQSDSEKARLNAELALQWTREQEERRTRAIEELAVSLRELEQIEANREPIIIYVPEPYPVYQYDDYYDELQRIQEELFFMRSKLP